MKTISLNGIWQLRGRPQEDPCLEELALPAEVPGCVQLDLSREGYLPADLYMGENILKTQQYEGYEWWYSRSFSAPEEGNGLFLCSRVWTALRITTSTMFGSAAAGT